MTVVYTEEASAGVSVILAGGTSKVRIVACFSSIFHAISTKSCWILFIIIIPRSASRIHWVINFSVAIIVKSIIACIVGEMRSFVVIKYIYAVRIWSRVIIYSITVEVIWCINKSVMIVIYSIKTLWSVNV
jgi:hypothetical protein